ncbi:MAG: hypothetical protein ACYDH5_14345 [Acidimicrobiales bacterium]
MKAKAGAHSWLEGSSAGRPGLGAWPSHLRRAMADRCLAARAYTREHGEDDPEISEWSWAG